MDGRALLAWNLRRLRVARGISQVHLAADAGINRVYVGELERGQANPTLTLIDRLAEVLGVSVAELFVEPAEGVERPKPLASGRKPKSQ